ncbi:craniofacial development protein 2-like [Cottoperca gobio]|uniref:Craniofacial development protein 2-like n=1 Tax=Cottoperca gobio TaxID=56716 RepID=A0A6J2RRA8_COTGO|nr:craniofacial development protein 2-like [Cottoperca gobio]
MENKVIPNPILPAAGVRRNQAADGGAGPLPGGQYDDRTANPDVRVLSDHSTRSKALLRCRRPFTMGSFNANTVREEGRLEELAHCAEERRVEILGIQEHRRVHSEDQIVYHRVEKCWSFTSSAWRNEAQAATGGVGLLLSSRALLRVHYHTNRILSADFDGNPVTTVIVVYSPTNVAQAEEVEKFYEDLATAVHEGETEPQGPQTKPEDPV